MGGGQFSIDLGSSGSQCLRHAKASSYRNTIVVLQVRGERLGGAMKAALAAAGRRLEPGWTYPVATGNFAVEHSEKTFGEPGLQFTDTDQSVRDVLMRRIEARGFE